MANPKPNIGFFPAIISRFRRVFVLFVLIISFFIFYNTFLIDRTLENLRFSLEQTALAYDTSDLNGLDVLLNQVMVDEITPQKTNVTTIANLEYVRNAISGKKDYHVIDYMKTSLGSVIKEKEEKRGVFLSALDNINQYLRKIFDYLLSLPRHIFRARKC